MRETNFKLKDKTILIISSEKWNDLRLSKHHYAEELSFLGNDVYFLNPPNSSKREPVISMSINPNLHVLDYCTHVKGERFWPLSLINLIRKKQAKKIQTLIGKPIDIIWSFFPNQFHDLKNFEAQKYIFHPVDRITEEKYRATAKHADIVISVAHFLLNDFMAYNKHCYFINHGLSRLYEKESVPFVKKDCIKVGYVGNLLRPDIDHDIFLQIITSHPNIEFHVWGSFEYKHLDWQHHGEEKVLHFIECLKTSKNVFLKGLVHPEIVAQTSGTMDMFLCCYDPNREINRASNNHKLMEYLSSGKVVVSHFVETYADKRALVEMCDDYDNHTLPILFKEVVQQIEIYNAEEKMLERRTFALENTYRKQIERIEALLD